jgi:hypothetical protein
MKTDRSTLKPRTAGVAFFAAALLSLAWLPLSLHAQGSKKNNPASRVYIADVSGEAQIDTGNSIQDLNKRSVYNAQGTVIETKKSKTEDENGKTYSTMVYSNGTGAYFDQDTHVEVKRFVQEPFKANRTDMEVEPSISQTQAFVSHGTVGLCTSKLVAGSTMTYTTPHGTINIHGRKVVIEANDNQTKISMLEGDSTVRAGSLDLGGHTLHTGQQAIIRSGGAGQPNIIQVSPIPPAEASALDDKVSMACMAKKTVYFEVKERQVDSGAAPGSPEAVVADSVATTENATAQSSSPGAGDAPVTAFDGNVANSGSTDSVTTVSEIVPVEVVPKTLPVEFTTSPSMLITRPPGSGG